MKVQCDVCKREAAAVFCCADEAALCASCDGRVHCANKLAGKHRRFSLLHPSSPRQFPICDICQEKQAFLFCQEDRAILCRDCDAPIHTANELTTKHNRFLLTGIKLSPSATPAPAAANASSCDGSLATSSTTEDGGEPPGDIIHNVNPSQQKKPTTAAVAAATGAKDKSIRATATAGTVFSNSKVMAGDRSLCSGATAGNNVSEAATRGSSISEYLIKELPGWHVEDLLLDSSPATFAFSKMAGDDLMPLLEADLDAAAPGGGFSAHDCCNLSSWWVPQVPQLSPPTLPPLPPAHGYDHQRQLVAGTGMGGESAKLAARQLQQQYQRQHWAADDCFTVPEISTVQPNQHHGPSSYKRPRPASWCVPS